MTAGDGVVTPGNFASYLLSQLGFAQGIASNTAYQNVVNGWVHVEGGFSGATSGGAAVFNPLNAGCDFPNATGCVTLSNGAKVASFSNLQAAADSYAQVIKSGAHGYNYISPSGASTPLALANAISQSGWAASHYAQYTAAVTPPGAHSTVTYNGLAAYIFNTYANRSDLQSFYNTYNATSSVVSNTVAPPGSPIATAANAAQAAAQAGTTLTSFVSNFLASPNLLVNAVVLLTGLIMLVLGLKSLVGGQAGQAINIIGGATNAVGNSQTAGAVREGIGVARQPAEQVTGFTELPESETFTLPEFLKQTSTSEAAAYSPETPRAPSKSEQRHRKTRAELMHERAVEAMARAAEA